jgi:hypothetical protein
MLLSLRRDGAYLPGKYRAQATIGSHQEEAPAVQALGYPLVPVFFIDVYKPGTSV